MQASPQFTPPQGSSSGQSSSVWIFVGCGTLLLLMLCLGSGGLVYYAVNRGSAGAGVGGPGGPGVPPGTGPGVQGAPALPSRTVSATVTAVTGTSPAPVNSTCNFVVSAWPSTDSTTGVMCRAQMVCAGQLLFGGGNAGYFMCTVTDQPPSIAGSDATTTSQDDADAAMTIDTAAGTLTIHDDGGAHGTYSVTAHVDSVL